MNLIGGTDLAPTLLQATYATCMGLMLATFVCRTGNIIPCILFHGALDVLGLFEPDPSLGQLCWLCVAYVAACLPYAWYLHGTDRELVKRREA